jgi:hypothetical protein
VAAAIDRRTFSQAFFALSVGVLLLSLEDAFYQYVRFIEQMLRVLL